MGRGGRDHRLHTQRLQRGQDQLLDDLLNAQAPEIRARRSARLQLLPPSRAAVPHLPAAPAIGHRHPPTTATAQQQPLQQRAALARGPGTCTLPIGGNLSLVALELLPRDVALVMIADQHRPLLPISPAHTLDRPL